MNDWTIFCDKCGKEVKGKDSQCPHCGADNKEKWNKLVDDDYICEICGSNQYTIDETPYGPVRFCAGKGGTCINFEEGRYTKEGIKWLSPEQATENPVPAFTQPINLTPKCPTCGSNVIQKIGAMERGASIVGLGIFSRKINKSFKCKSCGHTW